MYVCMYACMYIDSIDTPDTPCFHSFCWLGFLLALLTAFRVHYIGSGPGLKDPGYDR